MKKKLGPYSLIVLQSLLYGFGDPISKAAYEVVPVCSLLTVRYAIAFGVLLLIAGRRTLAELRATHSRAWILPSVCISVSYLLSNLALKLTAATSVAFLRSLATILTPALAFAVFRKQYGWRHFAIGVLSVVGLFFLCGFGGLSGFGAGEVLSLLGALAMAAALLFGERALSEISAAALATLQIGVSAFLALIASLVMEGGVRVSAAGASVWWIICYLAVACSAAGFLLQSFALRRIPAKSVALAQCVCPVMTALFSFLLLGERLSAIGMVGAALILLCVCAEIRADD